MSKKININTIRKKIDSLDRQILNTINKRAGLAKEIGKLKVKNNKEFYAPHREKKIVKGLIKKNKGPLTSFSIDVIFREILNACRSLESKIKVAYLGPEATFSHQAALKNFGAEAQYVAVKSIADVFTEVEKKRANYGVVPIENSTEGVVNHTLDMFIESDLVICAEISMPIELCLLSKSGVEEDIKTIVSLSQPLAQCRNWLEENFPGIPVKEVSSTAEAANHAAKNRSIAAVASSTAAKLYRLEIIARGIEDSRENYTRFLVIGRNHPKRSGHDKTSIMFSIKDRVGGLHDMLMSFKKHNINLTKIESRPTKKKAWQYIFFVDFIGHTSEKKVKTAFHELELKSPFVKVMGSYPRAE
ncbi:MAG: prephenate dehydratase [Endomicrobiales bacterium]|nr:prephenate dehydratase [Endomicrobiales bacterium]